MRGSRNRSHGQECAATEQQLPRPPPRCQKRPRSESVDVNVEEIAIDCDHRHSASEAAAKSPENQSPPCLSSPIGEVSGVPCAVSDPPLRRQLTSLSDAPLINTTSAANTMERKVTATLSVAERVPAALNSDNVKPDLLSKVKIECMNGVDVARDCVSTEQLEQEITVVTDQKPFVPPPVTRDPISVQRSSDSLSTSQVGTDFAKPLLENVYATSSPNFLAHATGQTMLLSKHSAPEKPNITRSIGTKAASGYPKATGSSSQDSLGGSSNRRSESGLSKIVAEKKVGGQLRKAPEAVLPRYKCQRDCLLEEIQWMALDFRQERRWKISMSTGIAYACADSKMRARFIVSVETDQRCNETFSQERSAIFAPSAQSVQSLPDEINLQIIQKKKANEIADLLQEGWYGSMNRSSGSDAIELIKPNESSSDAIGPDSPSAEHIATLPLTSLASSFSELYFSTLQLAFKKIMEEYDLLAKNIEGKFSLDTVPEETKVLLEATLTAKVNHRDLLSRCQRLMNARLGTILRCTYSPRGMDIGLFILKLWAAQPVSLKQTSKINHFAIFVPRRMIMRWKDDFSRFSQMMLGEKSTLYSPKKQGFSTSADNDRNFEALALLLQAFGPDNLEIDPSALRVHVFPAELICDPEYILPSPIKNTASSSLDNISSSWNGILLDARECSKLFCFNQHHSPVVVSPFELIGHLNRVIDSAGELVMGHMCCLLPTNCTEEAIVNTETGTTVISRFITLPIWNDCKYPGLISPGDKELHANLKSYHWLDPECVFCSSSNAAGNMRRSASAEDVSAGNNQPTKTRSSRNKAKRSVGVSISPQASSVTTSTEIDLAATDPDAMVDSSKLVDVPLCEWFFRQFSSMNLAQKIDAPLSLQTNSLNVKFVELDDFQKRKYTLIVNHAVSLHSSGLSIFCGKDISILSEAFMLLQRVCFHNNLVRLSNDSSLNLGSSTISDSQSKFHATGLRDDGSSPDASLVSGLCLAEGFKDRVISKTESDHENPFVSYTTGIKNTMAPMLNSSDADINNNMAKINTSDFNDHKSMFEYFPGRAIFVNDGWFTAISKSDNVRRAVPSSSGKLNGIRDVLVNAISRNSNRFVVVIENIAEAHCVHDFISATLGACPFLAVESSALITGGNINNYNVEENHNTANHNGSSRINEVIYGDLLIIEDAIRKFNSATSDDSLSILLMSRTIAESFKYGCCKFGLIEAPAFYPQSVDLTIVMSWNWIRGFSADIFDFIPSRNAPARRTPVVLLACRDTVEEALVEAAERTPDDCGEHEMTRCVPMVNLRGKLVKKVCFGNSFVPRSSINSNHSEPNMLSILEDEVFLSLLCDEINMDPTEPFISPRKLIFPHCEKNSDWTELATRRVQTADAFFSFFDTLAFRRIVSHPFHFVRSQVDTRASIISKSKSMILSQNWISSLLMSDLNFFDANSCKNRISYVGRFDSDSIDSTPSQGSLQCGEFVHWWDYFLAHFECSAPDSQQEVSEADISESGNEIVSNLATDSGRNVSGSVNDNDFGEKLKTYLMSRYHHFLGSAFPFDRLMYSKFEDNAMSSALPHGRLRRGAHFILRVPTSLKPTWLIDFLTHFSTHFVDRYFAERCLDVGATGSHIPSSCLSLGLCTYIDGMNTTNFILLNYASDKHGGRAARGPGFGRSFNSFYKKGESATTNTRALLMDPLKQMIASARCASTGLEETLKLKSLQQQNIRLQRHTGLGVSGYICNIDKTMLMTHRDICDVFTDAASLSSLFETAPIANSAFLSTNASLQYSKKIELIESKTDVVVDLFYSIRNELCARGVHVDSQFFTHPLQSAAGTLLSYFDSSEGDEVPQRIFYSGPDYQKRPEKLGMKKSVSDLNRNIDDIYDLSDLMLCDSWRRIEAPHIRIDIAIRDGVSVGNGLAVSDSKESNSIAPMVVDDKKDNRKTSNKSENRKKNTTSLINNTLSDAWPAIGVNDSELLVVPVSSTLSHSAIGGASTQSFFSLPMHAENTAVSQFHIFGAPIGLDPFPRLAVASTRVSSAKRRRNGNPYKEVPLKFSRKRVVAVKGEKSITCCVHDDNRSLITLIERDMRMEPWTQYEANELKGLVTKYGQNWWLLESALNSGGHGHLDPLSVTRRGAAAEADIIVHHARSARQIQQHFDKLGGIAFIDEMRKRETEEVVEKLSHCIVNPAKEDKILLQSVNCLLNKLENGSGSSTTEKTTKTSVDIPATHSDHSSDMLVSELQLLSGTPTATCNNFSFVSSEAHLKSTSEIISNAAFPHIQALLSTAGKSVVATTSAIEKVVTSSFEISSRKRARLDGLGITGSIKKSKFKSNMRLLNEPSSSGLLGATSADANMTNEASFRVIGAHTSHEAAVREAYATALLGPLRILFRNSNSNSSATHDENFSLSVSFSPNFPKKSTPPSGSACGPGDSTVIAPDDGKVDFSSPLPGPSSSQSVYSPHLGNRPHTPQTLGSHSNIEGSGNHSIYSNSGLIGGLPGLKSLLTLSQHQSGAVASSWMHASPGSSDSIPDPDSLSYGTASNTAVISEAAHPRTGTSTGCGIAEMK